MAAPSKTQGTVILTHQPITHPGSAKGSVQDVSTKFSATLALFHAPIENTANTNPGRFLVQASAAASGDDNWFTIATFVCKTGTPATTTLSAGESDDTLGVGSSSGFNARDIVYIRDLGTLANSEWAHVFAIPNGTTIQLRDNLTNAKASSDPVWGQGDIFFVPLNLAAIGRIRVDFYHRGAAGADCHIKGMMITHDATA